MDFSMDCFDIEDDSDLLLHLIVNKAQPPARSYFLHKVMLKRSPFFKSRLIDEYADSAVPLKQRERSVGCRLLRWLQDCDVLKQESHAIKAELKEHVECSPPLHQEGDLKAMHIVLRSLYNIQPSVGESQDKLLLLKACRLARYYCLPDCCMAAFAAPLQAVTAEEVDVAILAALYCPTAGLLDCDALSKFLAICKERLLALFGDVPAVLVSKEARQQFCRLPHAAVLAWLKEDDLKVHSENCVVLLLSAWFLSQGNHACGKLQTEELAHHVRVQHLTQSYLHAVLPHQQWFKDGDGMARLSQLLLRRGAGHFINLAWKGPPAWLSGARRRTSLPPSLEKSFDVQATELQHKDWTRSSSLPSYLNGFFLGIILEKRPSTTAGPAAVSLGCFAGVDAIAMQEALGAWAASDTGEHAARVSYSLKICSKTSKHCILSGEAMGSRDILGSSGTSIKEVIAPFLVEGRLIASATFTEVQ